MVRPVGTSRIPVGRAVVAVVALMAAFALGRCSAPGGSGDAGDTDRPRAEVEPEGPTPPDPGPHLILDEPGDFLDALRSRFDGPITVRRVVYYDDRAFADVQDPEIPRHLDEYSFREGSLDPDASPVAAGPMADWEDELFPLEQVRADAIRAAGVAALEEFDDLEHPELTHLVVSRDADGEVTMSVFVSDPIRGGSGWISTSTTGEVLDVHR